MPTIIIFDKQKKEIIKVKIENTLFWHDPVSNEILALKGGALDLVNKVFDEKLNRYIPRIIDIFKPQEKISKSREIVVNWFNKYLNYNNTEASMMEHRTEGISITVPDGEIDGITYDLERNGIDFRIE